MKEFDLTPSPNLLKLLGDLRFDGWQCIAELIDNSIDAIINNPSLNQDQRQIQVCIPKPGKLRENQPLIVEDFAGGMDETELENAVRAGFSSKNTQTSLGLFGMGFNVATARLANIVEVWSSKNGMESEIGVRIDLKEMAKNRSFIRPRLTRSKRPEKKSGTQVIIYDYTPVAENILKIKNIIDRLNRSYSEKIFNEHNIKIKINDIEIKPFKFCIWNPTRTVKIKYSETPVWFEINHKIKDELFCENCFSWLGEPVDTTLSIECPICHITNRIIKKEIRIFGWIGLQRYPDPDHYGIDISRNGRILSRLDKSLFYWDNENAKDDPRMNPEYPRDTPLYNGRIVGQIEANFVIPKYTKDDFERDDKNWKLAVNFLRGDMPLQQDLANDFYKIPGINNSPLGKLFRYWRRIHPAGVKTLIFAKSDGTPDYITQRDWAQKFYSGDTEFQDDTKWWEAVNKADIRDTKSPGFNPLNPFGGSSTSGSGTIHEPSTEPEPEPEKYPGKKLLKKTLHFDIENLIGEKPYNLTLIDYFPDNDINQPIVFEPQGIGKFLVYLNNNHPMFRDFADGYEDLIYMEVAAKYSALKNSDEWSITRIYYELKAKYAPETMLSIPNMVAKATNLMRDIQNKLVIGNGIQLTRNPNLSEGELKSLLKNYLDIEGTPLVDSKSFVLNTLFLKYLDLNYLFRFIEDFPDILFDGKIFNLPYNQLDEDNKQHQLKKYSGYFTDVRWFMNDLHKMGSEAIKKRKSEIIRNRISIEILHGSFSK